MNRLGINFTADLQTAINDLPNVLAVGARRYNCVADDERRMVEVEEAGRYAIYERTVTLVKSTMKDVPALQSTVTLDTIKYQVESSSVFTESDTVILTLRRSDGG